ncbi:MAG: helix-turn-helix transcriptional regulator [Gammaproteobacteria bacterium]|nr:helix-turn-helix transcriptional regulator [Gammaproteobacteria bacterium]
MKAENELNTLLEKTDCLMSNLPGLVFIKDTSLNFVACNAAFQDQVKAKKENIIGQTDYDFPWAHYADLYRRRDQASIEKRTTVTALELMPVNKKDVLTVKAIKQPFLNNKGKILGVLGQAMVLSPQNNLVKSLFNVALVDKKNTAGTDTSPKAYEISHYPNHLKLTKRESECLFLLIRGKTTKEIARFLSISHRTVECYLEQIKSKLDVSTRFELINKAIETGMLEIIPKNKILENLYKNHSKWADFL